MSLEKCPTDDYDGDSKDDDNDDDDETDCVVLITFA